MVRIARRPIKRKWTAADDALLRQHSKDRTPVAKVSRQMQRTMGALRVRACLLGIGLGTQQWT
jgi:hypothetical protein